jgi:hypothetical protein
VQAQPIKVVEAVVDTHQEVLHPQQASEPQEVLELLLLNTQEQQLLLQADVLLFQVV